MPFPESDAHANAECGDKGSFPDTADVVQEEKRQDHGQCYNCPVEPDFCCGHRLAGFKCQCQCDCISRHIQDISCDIEENSCAEKNNAAQHIDKLDEIARIGGQQVGQHTGQCDKPTENCGNNELEQVKPLEIAAQNQNLQYDIHGKHQRST